ncbi:MAG: hypothetical protein M0Z41_07460 [Peptococcaceae bacterium]|nr:hypothetical protein [Peptococcaceae bacterium]
MGGACTVRVADLPRAQYIAPGHLHRPQTVREATGLCRYAALPLAYGSFETGRAKSVVVVDVEPWRPAEARQVFLTAGRPLVRQGKDYPRLAAGWP